MEGNTVPRHIVLMWQREAEGLDAEGWLFHWIGYSEVGNLTPRPGWWSVLESLLDLHLERFPDNAYWRA